MNNTTQTETVAATREYMVRFCPAGENEWQHSYFSTRDAAEAVRAGMEKAGIPTTKVVEVLL
jgi:hypothetical protein